MLVNLTRRAIDVYDDEERLVATLPPSGLVAELVKPASESVPDRVATGRVRLFKADIQGICGIPAPTPGILYVVDNWIAKEGRHDRDDLVTPYKYVRRNGRVVGCKAFIAFS